jgi:GNAT superfamily N-acetyltransferase
MRSQEFITEIKRIDDFQYTGGKKALRVGLAKKDFQKLPGNNALMYSTEINRDENGIIIKLWDSTKQMPKPVRISGEDRYDFAWRLKDWARTQNEGVPGLLIGKLVLEDVKHFPIKGAVQVDTITVDEDYRKQGIAKSLYGVALSILRRPLLAGSMQTPGGQRNWMSLAAIPGVEVKGYIEIPQARFKNPNSDQDIDVIMGRLGGQYIGKSRSVYYFAFDVLPGSGELTPAVKTSLNQLYGFPNKFWTGMYATWSAAVTESGVNPGVAASREKFNTDLMKPGFEFTQKIISNTVELRGDKQVTVPVTITYKVVTSELGQPMVTALDPEGKQIGHAVFWNHQTRSGLESISTEVDDDWQGLGIAANMYAVVRMLGANINPSLFQTKQGKNMWKKWQQQGDIAQLKSMNAKIKEQGVAEGEVVPLGKKHRGDLDSINSCSKCGGKLEGGTYMGQRIKVCLPCKQVYLPPNSGIDQQGNKIKEQGVAENFDDGKNPGRKGLAKRVGVDCKQPVAKLRSIASNSSGEKQRMAHWCANMKSGKNK